MKNMSHNIFIKTIDPITQPLVKIDEIIKSFFRPDWWNAILTEMRRDSKIKMSAPSNIICLII